MCECKEMCGDCKAETLKVLAQKILEDVMEFHEAMDVIIERIDDDEDLRTLARYNNKIFGERMLTYDSMLDQFE